MKTTLHSAVLALVVVFAGHALAPHAGTKLALAPA